MRLLSSVGLVGAGLAMAGGCHLIVGIRDAEPYELDAGVIPPDCTVDEVQACYGGPAETEGVGICRAGTQTCSAEGEWGPCEGAVLPEQEDCSKPADEDCNGSVCSETLWVKQFGGQTSVQDVAVDPHNGNIYVAGTLVGPLTIGSDTLDSGSFASVALLAKFDKDGTLLWAKQFGKFNASWEDDEGALASSVAIDGQGNVVLVGTASPTINLGDGELPRGVFITKLSPSGEPIWGRVCESEDAIAQAVVDTETNDVVLAGTFARYLGGSNTIKCESSTLSSDDPDIFIARLAADDGSLMMTKQLGGPGSDTASNLAMAAQGSILLTGSTENGFSFGGTSTVAGPFVAKLASNGSPVWRKEIGEAVVRGIAVDAMGDPALTGLGLVTGPLNFGGGELFPLGDAHFDLFVARLNGTGNHDWSKRYESHSSEDIGGSEGTCVAIDSKGRIAVTGGVSYGNAMIGDALLTGNDDSFLVQFDASGSAKWSKMLGTPRGHCLAFSPLDEPVIAGTLKTPTDFGTGLITPTGQRDLILLKIAP